MAFPIAAAVAIAAEFLPWMVGKIAGPKAQEIADKVGEAAKAVTGKEDPADIATTLRLQPELLVQFRVRSAEIEADLDKAYLADRGSARQMSIELAKIGASDARRKNAMIIGDVVGLVACLLVLTFVPDLPGEVRGIVSTIAGFFGLGLRDAHQFEFGSSRGSETKTKLLGL